MLNSGQGSNNALKRVNPMSENKSHEEAGRSKGFSMVPIRSHVNTRVLREIAGLSAGKPPETEQRIRSGLSATLLSGFLVFLLSGSFSIIIHFDTMPIIPMMRHVAEAKPLNVKVLAGLDLSQATLMIYTNFLLAAFSSLAMTALSMCMFNLRPSPVGVGALVVLGHVLLNALVFKPEYPPPLADVEILTAFAAIWLGGGIGALTARLSCRR